MFLKILISALVVVFGGIGLVFLKPEKNTPIQENSPSDQNTQAIQLTPKPSVEDILNQLTQNIDVAILSGWITL